MCEKGDELKRPNYTLENVAVFEENISSLVLTYTSGVCVFPARFGFPVGVCMPMYLLVPCISSVLCNGHLYCCTVGRKRDTPLRKTSAPMTATRF